MIHVHFINLKRNFETLRPKKKKMYVSDRLTDPNIFYTKKKIDQQNPEIRLRFRVCFRLQQ